MRSDSQSAPAGKGRVQFLYVAIIIVGAIFIFRAFYLQIWKHDYYKSAALSKQLKEYQIPAQRGTIAMHDGDAVVPVVLNQKLYTLFADPKYVTKAREASLILAGVTGGKAGTYEKQLRTADSRYQVLAKKLSKEKSDKIRSLKLKGIGTREESYRTYPQGQLASQSLGFVNADGAGQYGIEQYMNDKLQGEPGFLKAITDASGVPLVSNQDNVLDAPKQGQEVVMTVDISLQRQVEELLKKGMERAKAPSGSVVVMDPNTGAVKAMANFPTYDPAAFEKVDDVSTFANAAVSSPLEVGSIMKTLTTAAALDKGVVNMNTSYYDASKVQVDDRLITNIEEDGGPGTKSLFDLLQLSLNTGAVHLLQQMGGGELNLQARTVWYDYLTNHYHFGKVTGIEQAGEANGVIPKPDKGYGLNVQYANMSFGQGMTVTPLQMAAALSSVLNGGTYYRPRLVERLIDSSGQATEKGPEKVSEHVVGPGVGENLRKLMEYVVKKNNPAALHDGYSVGGKTGTAEIASPTGGYYTDKFNGTYAGFVGGNKPQYVIIVRVNEPKIKGYAGSQAAGPIFADITQLIINTIGVTPVGQ